MKRNSRGLLHRAAHTALFTLSVLSLLCLAQCTKETKKDTGATKNGNSPTQPNNRDILSPEYQREGFISRDLYRIVIVAPADECPDMSYVDKNARQRAFMSLQKHLESRGKIIDQNTRARLLNLITEKGKVKNLDCRDEKRKAFSFEIEMKNLSQYVDSLAGQR